MPLPYLTFWVYSVEEAHMSNPKSPLTLHNASHSGNPQYDAVLLLATPTFKHISPPLVCMSTSKPLNVRTLPNFGVNYPPEAS